MIKPFLGDKGILEILLDRLIEASLDTPLILATTVRKEDDILADIALQKNISVCRGEVNDVLRRFIDAAQKSKLTHVIRICADNPFLDVEALRYQIEQFKYSDVDYWCYSLSDGTPTIKTHYGFWSEAIKTSALERIADLTHDPLYREHVTNFIYTHSDVFSIHKETIPGHIEKYKLRLTIDTLEDFNNLKDIYENVISKQINTDADSLSRYISGNEIWLDKMVEQINKNKK